MDIHKDIDFYTSYCKLARRLPKTVVRKGDTLTVFQHMEFSCAAVLNPLDRWNILLRENVPACEVIEIIDFNLRRMYTGRAGTIESTITETEDCVILVSKYGDIVPMSSPFIVHRYKGVPPELAVLDIDQRWFLMLANSDGTCSHPIYQIALERMPIYDDVPKTLDTPEEYKKICLFVLCYRNSTNLDLPECLFGHICRDIMDTYWLQAECRIENYTFQ